MSSLNKVILIGTLTREPELRYTSGGAAVCGFGLAMNQHGNAITTPEKKYIKRSYRGFSNELWEKIWAWAEETGNTGGNIKKANKAFSDELNAVSEEHRGRITVQAYEEAIRLFEATNSAGLAGEVIALLTA